MAKLKGENGKITIDDNEAYQDIKRIQHAREMVENAMRLIARTGNACYGLQGHGASRLSESVCSISDDLRSLEDEMGQANLAIQRIVARYQEIDRNIRSRIEGI